MALKTPSGRLTEEGARTIRRLRDEKTPEGKPRHTYAQIAAKVDVTLGTVFNVCTDRTWGWLK